MPLDDEQLEQLYRQGTRRPTREGCPPAESFQRALQLEMRETERGAFADHLATCRDCAEEFKLLQPLKEWAQQAAADLERSRFRRTGHGRLLGLAATILIGIGVSLTVWWNLQETEVIPAPLRGEETSTAESPAGTEISPADGEVLATAPHRLAWMPVPGTTYTVEIYDAESLPVWTSPRLTEGTVDLPEGVRSGMRPGEQYYWRVLGDRDGQRSKSALFQFSLQP